MIAPDLLGKMDAYWRTANYLWVRQLHLRDNPLLRSRGGGVLEEKDTHLFCPKRTPRPAGPVKHATMNLMP